MTSKPLHVLLVDDDQDFTHYIASISASFNMSLKTCHTLGDAVKLLKNAHFDAYIIDLQLPDGSGYDLLKIIRDKSRAKVAVVSGVFHDNESFRKLKEQFGIDYVLGKPVYHDQVERLLHSLASLRPDKKAEKPEELDHQILKIYQNSICDKIDLLANLITGLQHHPGIPSLQALKEALHKIAGSAGSYGYPDVTKHCRELEYEINSLIENEGDISKKWLTELTRFLDQIKFDFQFSRDGQTTLSDSSRNDLSLRNTLYVLDPEEKFLSLLEKERERTRIKLLTEKNPERGVKQLLSPEFNPGAVVIAQSLPGFHLSGLEIVEKMQQKDHHLPTVFGILSKENDLDLRIQLKDKGVDSFFVKPISPALLFDTILNKLPSAKLADYKVLVLDDDDDICRFIKQALESVGLDVHTINEASSLFASLEEFMPNVLILDVLLPKYNGLDLLKAVKADPIYKNLSILISTHFNEEAVSQAAYSTKDTEVLFKPFDAQALQKIILRMIDQKPQGFGSESMTLRTGLSSSRALRQDIKELISRETEENMYLAVFEIEDMDGYILKGGHSLVNQLLVSFGNFLNSVENEELSAYFLESKGFALLIERDSLAAAEDDVLHLLLKMKNETADNVALCAGVVGIGRHFKTVDDAFRAVRNTLETAKKSGEKGSIKIQSEEGAATKKAPKDVLIIDPDNELQQLIANALKNHGLNVRSFSTGEKALEALNHYTDGSLPELVISEKKMPDMDGTVILDKVKSSFRRNIPFFFLTLYSSDHDISEGISHGAEDYITKPFNLTILTKKVLAAIERNNW